MQAWKCQSNIHNVIPYVRTLLTIKIVYRLNVSIYHDQLFAEPTTTISFWSLFSVLLLQALLTRDKFSNRQRNRKKSLKRINFMKYSLYLLKSLSHNNEITLIYKCKPGNDNQIYLTWLFLFVLYWRSKL